MNVFFIILSAFILSIFFNKIIIYLSKKYGWVEKVKKNRWHNREVAKFGGVAIFLSTIIVVISFFISAYIIYNIFHSSKYFGLHFGVS